jgi:transcription elongation factor GreA
MSKQNTSGPVAVGTWVKLVEHGSGDEEVFHIVNAREVNYLENKIPSDNPMGRALVGAKPGEDVVVEGPHGTVTFSVVEVGRGH